MSRLNRKRLGALAAAGLAVPVGFVAAAGTAGAGTIRTSPTGVRASTSADSWLSQLTNRVTATKCGVYTPSDGVQVGGPSRSYLSTLTAWYSPSSRCALGQLETLTTSDWYNQEWSIYVYQRGTSKGTVDFDYAQQDATTKTGWMNDAGGTTQFTAVYQGTVKAGSVGPA